MRARRSLGRPSRLATALVLAALAILPLSSCAAQPPELEAQSAAQFQTAVLAVSEASASGDYDMALVELDALKAALEQATTDEQLSAARAARIAASIALVRADLAELAAAQVVSTPAPSTEPPYDPDCNKGQEKKGTCSSEEPGDEDDSGG